MEDPHVLFVKQIIQNRLLGTWNPAYHSTEAQIMFLRLLQGKEK